ncbi:hypothetical protein HAX54_002636 [Datura stramonium]|uniref:Uncharacterized protein n=1 Tax=Datura stramonium TaxID=4076 RepID=A0ABS8WV90_DATST|nr:hypothetical protein [Datura stramonium]
MGVRITSASHPFDRLCQPARCWQIAHYESENLKDDDHWRSKRRIACLHWLSPVSTNPGRVKCNERKNIVIGRNLDRPNERQPISDMLVMSDESPMETRVQTRDYKPLPQTRVPLALRSSRMSIHRCDADDWSLYPAYYFMIAAH